MRRRNIEIGQAYAVRPLASDRLPDQVVITAVEDRVVRWTDPETGRNGRCGLRDVLGPWDRHAAVEQAAYELVDRLRGLPEENRWFEAVHVGYGGYANFGVIAHLSVTQAERIAAAPPPADTGRGVAQAGSPAPA